MKTTTIAISALAILLVAGVATTALANPRLVSGALNMGRDDSNGHQGSLACRSLTVGQTITVSSLTGKFLNASNHQIRGNATGTLSLQVSQKYATGCTLMITGGSFKIGSAAYNVTRGSVILNHGGRVGIGSGSVAGGSFLIGIRGLHDSSGTGSVGAVQLDLKSGANEFLAIFRSH